MSTNINGKKCAGCGAYLFEEDDVVFCPVCGAPHHRDCYNSKGHCAFESLHGTDRQYDKVQEETEKEAQRAAKKAAEKSQEQGSVYNKRAGEGIDPITILQFDPLGGIPEDFDLGEGVTADDAKQFVFSNSHRYIPKFAAAKNGRKASFNWLAFLVPPAWFLSRKMYKMGIFTLVLSISFSLLMFPFLYEFDEFLNSLGAQNTLEMVTGLIKNVNDFEITGMIACSIASALNVLMSVLCGIFGDYIYRNHAISTIKEIKADGLDVAENMQKKGGVNFFVGAIGFLIIQYLPTFIYGFII